MNNLNLVENQNILTEFVNSNVFADVTDVVEYILSTSSIYGHVEPPFNHNDIKNYYIDNSEEILKIEDIFTDIETYEYKFEEGEISEEDMEYLKELKNIVKNEDLENKLEELRDNDGEFREVVEWWQVSSMLCKKLEEKGEAVIPHMNYWGRCTSGQGIILDGVIEEIAEDLGLLK